MDELYLQLKRKLENKQEQVITTFNKLIQNLKPSIIIGLIIIPIIFVSRYYKFNIYLLNSIINFYIGVFHAFFIRKSFRVIEYKSTLVLEPAQYRYFGIMFLILSLAMLIAYIIMYTLK